MLSYDFMIRAFLASGIVAIVAGAVGYFLVLRGQTFAGHGLAHIACAGATGAALFGLSPLLGSPRMILFDEPLIGLDPHQQHNVVALVRELSRSLKLTVLMSAHELNQLLGAIDRVLYLGHCCAALGTVDEVIRPDVLSRLYDAPIEVLRADGHIFVMSRGQDIEREHAHEHEHPHEHPQDHA